MAIRRTKLRRDSIGNTMEIEIAAGTATDRIGAEEATLEIKGAVIEDQGLMINAKSVRDPIINRLTVKINGGETSVSIKDYALIAVAADTRQRNADRNGSKTGMNGEAEDEVVGGIQDRKAEEITHRVIDQIRPTLPANLAFIGTNMENAGMETVADLSMMRL